MEKILNIIKTKSFKIVALCLALTICVTGAVWHLATPVHAQELTIDNTNVQTFAGARAITNDELVGTATDPATMSVFVIDGTIDKYKANNMQWTHNGTGWTSDQTVFFAGANSIQKIYACSPYAENIVDGTKVTVTASEQIDWLVATATPLITEGVDLKMTHALAKLVINPTFGTEATNRTITSIEVKGMYASGTLNIFNNTWSNTGDANATLTMNENYELLVIPMVGTSFPITITMEDGRIFTTDISLAQVSNQLAPGTQYNISLQVGQNVVNLGEIAAEDWVPAPGGILETE